MGNKARVLKESEQQDTTVIASDASQITLVLKEVAEKFFEPNILIIDEQSLVNRLEPTRIIK